MRSPTSASGKRGGTATDDGFPSLTSYQLLLPRRQPPAFPDSLAPLAPLATSSFLRPQRGERGRGEPEDAGQVPGSVGGGPAAGPPPPGGLRHRDTAGVRPPPPARLLPQEAPSPNRFASLALPSRSAAVAICVLQTVIYALDAA